MAECEAIRLTSGRSGAPVDLSVYRKEADKMMFLLPMRELRLGKLYSVSKRKQTLACRFVQRRVKCVRGLGQTRVMQPNCIPCWEYDCVDA